MNIRYGIIGPGVIAHKFADAVRREKDIELVSVAARDLSRAVTFAKKYKATKAYGSYTEIMGDPDVDIIYIGVTHNFHYDVVKACLSNHKAVLCEKPLVLTKKEAEELADLAKKNNTLLMEAMWTRCMPAYQQARTWVREGKIGEVKLIDTRFHFLGEYDPNSRWYDPKLAGGSLFDLGVYPIEFTTGILSENPTSVNGLAKIAPTGVDESAAVSMTFASGALATFSCGFTVNAKDDAFIYGTKGKIVLNTCYDVQKAELFDERDRRVRKFEERVPNGFIYEARHCAELFRQGKLQSDLIPLADTVVCAGVFDTLRKQWGLI